MSPNDSDKCFRNWTAAACGKAFELSLIQELIDPATSRDERIT